MLSKGITIPLDTHKTQMSATQAAWRFYNNDKIKPQELFGFVPTQSDALIKQVESEYVLVAHDWSWLDYKTHNSKEDLIVVKSKGDTKSIGYDLQTSLLIDPSNGSPLAPIAMNLKTSKNLYSTYDENLEYDQTHLQELSKRCAYIDERVRDTSSEKQIVHIVDREADSVLFMRQLQK